MGDHKLGFWQVIHSVKRGRVCPVLVHDRVGPGLPGHMIEVEPIATGTRMHRSSHLMFLNQCAHVSYILRILIIHKEPVPDLPATVRGDIRPSVWAGTVIHPECHKVGQPLQHKWLARRPDCTSPHEIIKPMHRAPHTGAQPVIGGPLNRAALTIISCHNEG